MKIRKNLRKVFGIVMIPDAKFVEDCYVPIVGQSANVKTVTS